MNIMKKMLPVLLCVMMVVVMFAVTTYAANGQTNIGMDVSATTVNVDDTFTITVYYDDMNVASFGCTLQFDANLVELVSVVGCDEEVPEDIGLCRGRKFDDAEISSIEDANTNGQIGLIVVNTSDKDYDECEIYTATFRAKASGDVTFTLTEKSSNVTYGVGDGFGGVAATQTVTIAGSACEHSETKLVCKDEGKHDIVCANDACGEIIDTVDCGGENTIYTDNGDWTHKKACKCGHLFEEAISHDFEDGKCACGLEHEHDYSFNSYYELHYSNPGLHVFVTECVCGACKWGEESRHVDANHDGRCELCNASGLFVAHSHDHYEFSETQHWSVCSCGATVDESVTHEYTYDCDTSCNICDYEREAEHEYFYPCDQACMLCHKVTNPGAEHSVVHVDANPATCTENGNVEYWYCDDCGMVWMDEALTQEGNRFTVTLAASCKYGAIHREGIEPGCHYTGLLENWYCANCDVFYADAACTIVTGYKDLVIPALKTTAEYVPAKDATCTEDGNIECWTCYDCEQVWLDEALTQLTTWKATRIPAGHTSKEVKYENITDTTHDVHYACCGAVKEAGVAHTYDATTFKCECGKNKKFSISWTVDGKPYATIYYEYDSVVTAPEAPTKAGYTFGGWNVEPGFTMPGYNVGTISNKAWVPNEYSVIFDGNGGTWGAETTQSISVRYEDYFLTPAAGPNRTGYTLVGWNTAADGSGDALTDRTKLDVIGDNQVTYYAQWEINTYTLTVNVYANGETVELTVPYGANLLEALAKAAEEGLIPALGDTVPVNDKYNIGINIAASYCYYVDDEEGWISISENDTMPASDFEIDQECTFTGWGRPDADQIWGYQVESIQIEGWYEVDGFWYFFYLSEETGWSCRAEGLTRVPYPTAKINGVTYAPNAEDLAYAASKGKNFIDATEAWFVFDNTGKFMVNETGIVNGKYVKNGMIAWHPGVVEVDGEAYYFVGDAVNGGNMLAQGDVYITRNTENIEAFVNGACYNFKDGQLSGLNGIEDGKYYENSRLMLGAGLRKIGDNYIYVRSNGYVVMDDDYYVPANNQFGIVSALYHFDANGYMVNPNTNMYNGIVNGFYYVDGKVQYGAGLINLNGDIYYVRSSGKVVTGSYYVTNTNDMVGFVRGQKLFFGEDGKLITKDTDFGSVINGYYYVNGKIAYGAGVVELKDDDNRVFYIYVKSNGQLATGKYWPTTLNGKLAGGEYDWGTDGKYYPEG